MFKCVISLVILLNPILALNTGEGAKQSKVLFFLSTTPFYCGVPNAVNWDKISFSMRYTKNSLDNYSPSQSN